MKAMVFDKYGGPEVLHEVELPSPTPSPHQVRLQVIAVGINPVDWKLRSGMFKYLMPLKLPKILGFDVCGRVLEIGAAVSEFAPGDLVHGMVDIRGQGACATEVCLDASAVCKKPETMTDEEAASIPLAGLTALQALRDKVKLQAGERLLVIGASGGVGMFAAQIAAAMGAQVTGVCSSKNVDFVQSLGIQQIIAYDKESYEEAGQFDVIFDTVGAMSFFQAKKLLVKTGQFVSPVPVMGNIVSQIMGPLTPLLHGGRRSFGIMVRPSGTDVSYLDRLYTEKQLKTQIEATFALQDLARAHQRSASGRVVGKLVVRIGDN